ncbi:MAG TPA: hypothetical protein VKP64_11030 [Mycobacteriales bacterium]|nr:hypothetical protein [Mycobacteriales bacterium]
MTTDVPGPRWQRPAPSRWQRPAPSRWQRLGLALSLLALTGVGCAGGGGAERAGPTGNAAPPARAARIDPANFQTTIDNPYLPLLPGTRMRYEGASDGTPEIDTVEVTHGTKRILGVPTVVVRDTVTRHGVVVEDTRDWYAQDLEGNVWYFGEDTKTYRNRTLVSAKGSWEAGRDGAEPGIAMKAHPRVGDRYRQEYYRGVAEDMGEVLSVDEQVRVRAGSFRRVVKTKDFSPLEPNVIEHKYYAPGVGEVLETSVRGESDRLELVAVTRP